MITLSGITLPVDLVWEDEFKFSSVVQDQRRTLTGALIVQESVRLKGRPITLVGDAGSGWIDRTTLLALQVLADTVDTDLALSFHGTAYTVRFDRTNGESPIDGSPIIDCSDPGATDPYSITVRLLTV